MERIQGIRRESPEPLGPPGTPRARPWELLGMLLGPPGTPLGPPRDDPGIPGDPREPPRTTKTSISKQIYSARSSRLLHPNPFVARHHSEDPPQPNGAPFGPLATGLRTGFTPVLWPLVPWLYIDVHKYTYMHTNIWRYLIGCFDESPGQKVCTPTFVLTGFEYVHACIRPTERSMLGAKRRGS